MKSADVAQDNVDVEGTRDVLHRMEWLKSRMAKLALGAPPHPRWAFTVSVASDRKAA